MQNAQNPARVVRIPRTINPITFPADLSAHLFPHIIRSSIRGADERPNTLPTSIHLIPVHPFHRLEPLCRTSTFAQSVRLALQHSIPPTPAPAEESLDGPRTQNRTVRIRGRRRLVMCGVHLGCGLVERSQRLGIHCFWPGCPRRRSLLDGVAHDVGGIGGLVTRWLVGKPAVSNRIWELVLDPAGFQGVSGLMDQGRGVAWWGRAQIAGTI